MTNCKVLSFKEIHETNEFFKDCVECVNKNYRKNLELVEENARAQQAKMDVLYWKERAEAEGTKEMVDMYERFNSELARRTKANNANNIPPLNPASNLNTSFNNSFNLPPPPQMNGNTPRGAPLSLSDLTGPARVSSASTGRVNAVLDSAESLIRRLERPAGPFGLSAEQLANSRAGLRPTNTRPPSAAPASNTSQRAQQSSALMDELRASIASRASRGSRRARPQVAIDIANLTPPGGNSPEQLSPVDVANLTPPGGNSPQQLPRRGRPVNLTASEVRSLIPENSRFTQLEETVGSPRVEMVSGSGLRKAAGKKRAPAKKKTASKKNVLM